MVLRRKRSLEAVAGSSEPRDLLIAALVKVFGLSGRSLDAFNSKAISGIKVSNRSLPDAVRADLPDWLWQRLEAEYGAGEAMEIARGLPQPGAAGPAREPGEAVQGRSALERLGMEAAPTPHLRRPESAWARVKPQTTAMRCSWTACLRYRTKAARSSPTWSCRGAAK